MLLKDPHGAAQAEGACGRTLWSCGRLSPSYSTSRKRQTQEKVTITVGASAH